MQEDEEKEEDGYRTVMIYKVYQYKQLVHFEAYRLCNLNKIGLKEQSKNN
jgi:hypothetical protein